MPGPCNDKNILLTLVTDYIFKREEENSFEYNLVPKLIHM